MLQPADRMAEIDAFLRFTRETWPQLRAGVIAEIARRCSICAVSERHSPLTNGICAECDSYAVPTDAVGNDTTDATELDRILQDHQGRAAGNYDALVMFSGGKDSALLLHLLRLGHPGLRLLAVMVDNGFTSTIALENARRVSSLISDVDYLTIKPKESLFRNTFRYALTHLNAGGCYSSVDRLAGDLAFDIGRNTAARFGIPLVLHGGTRAQAQKILGLFSYETPRAWERVKRESTGGFPLREIYDEEDMRYWWDGSAWPEERVPRVLFPFCAWPYDEDAVRQEVQRLGLLDKGNENPIASNSHLLPINFAVDTFRLGYSGYEPELSQLIREGRAPREPWQFVFESIEYLARRGELLPRCVAATLERIGLSHRELGLPEPVLHRASAE